MKSNYCLPIIKSTESEILEVIKNTQADYQYFEIWLDYIEDLDDAFIKNLCNTYSNKLIFVLRRKNLEKEKMFIEKRWSILQMLNNKQMFVDLDVITQKKELEYISDNKLSLPLITSYHNYQSTPDEEKLKEIINTMKKYHPKILKISTLCNSPKDSLRLLDLLIQLKEQQAKCIILGMGEYGTITRIFGTLWGNEMIFAPEKNTEASASGQITRKSLEAILQELNAKR